MSKLNKEYRGHSIDYRHYNADRHMPRGTWIADPPRWWAWTDVVLTVATVAALVALAVL